MLIGAPSSCGHTHIIMKKLSIFPVEANAILSQLEFAQ